MDDRIEQARTLYERAVFAGDADGLDDAERTLDTVEADASLARGRVLHARFLLDRERSASPPAEDPAELPLFRHALELYRASGDVRGEAEALFWIGCLHQVIRRDDRSAVPDLERSRELAARVGDRATEAEALRHLGIAAHNAGRLDEAREWLTESTRLRRECGAMPAVAANMVGLAYVTAAQDRPAEALTTLDEAHTIAEAHGARTVVRQVDHARRQIRRPR